MRYSFSILVTNFDFNNIRHNVGTIEAANNDEATDLAYKLAHKLYPAIEGWKDHHILVTSTDINVISAGNIDTVYKIGS